MPKAINIIDVNAFRKTIKSVVYLLLILTIFCLLRFVILRSTKETNHKIFDSHNLILYMQLITKLQNENIGTYEMPEKLIIPVKY